MNLNFSHKAALQEVSVESSVDMNFHSGQVLAVQYHREVLLESRCGILEQVLLLSLLDRPSSCCQIFLRHPAGTRCSGSCGIAASAVTAFR